MPSSQHGRRRIVSVVGMVLLAGLAWAGIAPHASANDAVKSYVATMKVMQDGRVTVSATVTPIGSFPQNVTQRFATRERLLDNSDRVFDVTDVSVTRDENTVDANVTREGDYVVVNIPTESSSTPFTLTYSVSGAAIQQADDITMVQWRVLQGLSLPVDSVDITVDAEAQLLELDCVSGSPSSPSTCGWFGGGTHTQPDPVFHDGPRGAGEIVQPSIRYSSSQVAANNVTIQRWSLDRAFSFSQVELLTVLGLIVVGGLALWAGHRRIGRDATSVGEPTLVARFAPVGAGESEFVVENEIRPGLVGTVLDEHVDPIDITATVLDLAVRGHLLITELPRESEYTPTDWSFTRREDAVDELSQYEKTVLDTLTPREGIVTASEIGPAVAAAVPQIQSELYDDVVERGWFASRPDETRNLWGRLGWIMLAVSVVAAVALIAFTTFGLVGLALIALSVGLLLVANQMPARTAAGTAVLAGMQALQSDLFTHPTDQVPAGREYEQLSRILPYAVVLGGQDRWLKALVAADDDEGVADPTDLDWYHAPNTWHLQDLPNSLRNFLVTLQGNLFSR